MSGSTASLVAAGTCTVQAGQSGSPVYAPAPTVTQSFVVNLIPQTITFTSIPAQIINTTAPVSLTASASSGLPVLFTSATSSVCTVSGSAATLVATGTCTIQADQPGDGVVYAAAPTVAQSFAVESASPQNGPTLGTVNIGGTSSAIAVPLTFTTSATLGSVSVLTEGASGAEFANAGSGTCAVGASYGGGSSCTVAVIFTPTFAGSRNGAIVLDDVSGNVISTTYINGIGLGPEVEFLPGTESVVATGTMAYPFGIAVDAGGNVYIADTGNGLILMETPYASGYTQSVVPTSTLASPSAVAVDGAGNIYVADTVNNQILKETLSEGVYTESALQTSALRYPSGVALDANGNVYIADYGNNRILMEAPSGDTYTESTIPTSPLSYPTGVAVDGSGNVYIADTYNNRVLKETLSSGRYTESILSTSSLAYPFGVAVDAVGDVYVADSYNNRVLKEVYLSGSYVENTVPTSTLSAPCGIAVSGSGNVYIADTYNNRVLSENLSVPGALSFALAAAGSSSSDSPQTVVVQNNGNAILTFPIMNGVSNPSISSDFPLSSGGSACPVVNTGASAPEYLNAGRPGPPDQFHSYRCRRFQRYIGSDRQQPELCCSQLCN